MSATVIGWDDLRPDVQRFAVLMERVLRKNDGKGGWKHEPTGYLSRRCGNELKELRAAMAAQHRERMQGFPPVNAEARRQLAEKVGTEAADVANFAMMIADVCGGLPAPTLPPPDTDGDLTIYPRVRP